MKKSDIIKDLLDEISRNGDLHVKNFKLTDENECTERKMLSGRFSKKGKRLEMNFTEFKEYVEKENSKLRGNHESR
jgi:hypothetical protein